MKPTIRAYCTSHYSDELRLLRDIHFPGSEDKKADPFDNRSKFFVFECDGNIMATGRLTINPDGPLISETLGKGNFRNEPDTLDMGKYLITKNYQGIVGLYELFCLSTFDYAIKNGILFGNASMIVGRRLLRRLENLHFKVCGEPVILFQSNGTQCEIVPLICDFKLKEDEIKSDLDKWIKEFSVNYTFIKEY